MSELILPFLPENLESLHKEEETNRAKSLLCINAEPSLKEHMALTQSSLNVSFDLVKVHQQRTDDELTIQYLGIRIFNAVASALKLMLSGYYQTSFAIQRDIVETGFLLDFFAIYPQRITEWKAASNDERQEKFKPSKIREALDERGKLKGKKRGQIYQQLCEYAAHPSYPGFKLVAPKGLGEIGPFYDEKYLKSALGELVLRVPFFTLLFMMHFKNLSPQFSKPHIEFIAQYKAWVEKHLHIDLSHIDTTNMMALVELL